MDAGDWRDVAARRCDSAAVTSLQDPDSVAAHHPAADRPASCGGTALIGTAFHVWRTLRFQKAIWHGFVLVAAGCHYAAVLRISFY